jgi:hypothetical protein
MSSNYREQRNMEHSSKFNLPGAIQDKEALPKRYPAERQK